MGNRKKNGDQKEVADHDSKHGDVGDLVCGYFAFSRNLEKNDVGGGGNCFCSKIS